MRSILTFCLSTASLILPQSAQQHSRPYGGGPRSQCSAPHDGGDSEVPRSSLLQVGPDAHHGASNARKALADKGLANGKAEQEHPSAEQHDKSGEKTPRQFGVKSTGSLSLSSTAAKTSGGAASVSSHERRGRHGSKDDSNSSWTGAVAEGAQVIYDSDTGVDVALAQTSRTNGSGVTFWVAIVTTIFISIIVTAIGYFLVCEDRDAKLWQRSEDVRSAPLSRGVNMPRPPELMTEKEEVRRELARLRAAEGTAIDPNKYSSPAMQVPSGAKSPGRGSRQTVPDNSPLQMQRSDSPGASIASPNAQPSGISDGSIVTNPCLCPGLIVPAGNECILAIRAILTPFAPTTPSMIDILDLQGKVVLKANISGRPTRRTNTLPTPEPPAVALRTSGPVGPNGEGEVLGICRQGELSHGRPSMYIYNVREELFGTLIRDNKGSGRWVFRDVRASPILYFDGNYFDRSIIITDEGGEQVADTEPWTGDFDTRGHYYKLRVVSETDVGLILCGLLSIEWLETAAMQP